jgi:hypothetical protein
MDDIYTRNFKEIFKYELENNLIEYDTEYFRNQCNVLDFFKEEFKNIQIKNLIDEQYEIEKKNIEMNNELKIYTTIYVSYDKIIYKMNEKIIYEDDIYIHLEYLKLKKYKDMLDILTETKKGNLIKIFKITFELDKKYIITFKTTKEIFNEIIEIDNEYEKIQKTMLKKKELIESILKLRLECLIKIRLILKNKI